MSTELIERLRHHHEHPVTGQMVLINPDGPRAAERIAELEEHARELEAINRTATAQVEAAESALSIAESRGRQIGREEAAKASAAAQGLHVTTELIHGMRQGDPEREFWRGFAAAKEEIAAAIRNLPTNEAGE